MHEKNTFRGHAFEDIPFKHDSHESHLPSVHFLERSTMPALLLRPVLADQDSAVMIFSKRSVMPAPFLRPVLADQDSVFCNSLLIEL